MMYYGLKVIYWPVLLILSLFHFPRFSGRENLPEGGAMLCANHSGLADPIWVVLLMHDKQMPWFMAKKEVMDKPVIGRFLSWFGAFGVDRETADIRSIKTALGHLRDGDKLLLFPEGTRVKKGKKVEAKSGAVLLASRANVPIVPIYITPNRKPFQPIRCIMGEPYHPQISPRHNTSEELEQATQELMRRIYALGDTASCHSEPSEESQLKDSSSQAPQNDKFGEQK